MNTLLLLDGGHSSVIKDIDPTTVEHALDDARKEGHSFLYLQASNYGVNGYAVDPHKVVAVIENHPR